MAKGLKAATVHEVSGGEGMEGFRSLFRLTYFFKSIYIDIEFIYIIIP